MKQTITAIVMPKLGLSMTEGSVADWHVEPGGNIAHGELIADIETSKITSELEAHVSGTLRRTVVELGVEVPVGTLIAVVADVDVAEAEIDAFVSAYVADESAAPDIGTAVVGDEGAESDIGTAVVANENQAPDIETGVQTPVAEELDGVADALPLINEAKTLIPASMSGSYDRDRVFASHHAHKLAQRLGINLATVNGSGRRGRISKQDVEDALASVGVERRPKPSPGGVAGPIKTTPMAKRLAAEHGVDLAQITPTGTRGRITKGDVLRYVEGRQEPSPVQMAAPIAAPESNPYEEVTLNTARRFAADRLSQSKLTAPHYRLSVDVIIDKLLELRRDIEGRSPDGAAVKVSINDMLVRAAAIALAEHDDVNIQFDGDTIRKFTHADVAVAVALDGGLITPIVHKADQKDLMTIAKETAGLVERAKAGKLLPDEIMGGTFTLSNLGMFGIKSFDAIINPPQAAIMAIGRAEKRLYVGEDNDGRVATFMTVTLSCDHRVIDGAAGARFLQTFKDLLQHPGRLLL